MTLTDFDARLLDFAERAPRALGAREEAIRAQLGVSPVRYYQRLNVLIDAPEAHAAHPLLMSRLARIRDRRARERNEDPRAD
ncbi:DUF3263 domain-containing protein [Corynebacterium uberis]|uniref:DUF3263 domain-containing protein n=1 Tax=Corynebacterium TaxID=1716 RepID=UPI001D0B33CB|nr:MULTISPECIES: DUF3263 domain-containing protein [Corynebacterium]MCZ9309718.1 DUF3263 domain-containing protein [Corynebacterium sp. c6VSa_13]UDL73522.1 DUF3263 domain-containing protein [Corynebacterium uberis]UDL75598.1 DUF3263 domain-containing protein [Corynebacterium uberis]UDL77811.1 DUF3263 domain-containing protein [Corynebacterium uberis]UDL80094.1 DUF3263 domain-containing protein [Corynebacterium uberis]